MADTIYIVRTPFLDGKVYLITGCSDLARDEALEIALRTRGEPVWVEEFEIGTTYDTSSPDAIHKFLFPTVHQQESPANWSEHEMVYPEQMIATSDQLSPCEVRNLILGQTA
jgi:hypothetical protein